MPYKTAKSGQKAVPAQPIRARRTSTAERGSKRAGILAVLEDNPHGRTCGEILAKLGGKQGRREFDIQCPYGIDEIGTSCPAGWPVYRSDWLISIPCP